MGMEKTGDGAQPECGSLRRQTERGFGDANAALAVRKRLWRCEQRSGGAGAALAVATRLRWCENGSGAVLVLAVVAACVAAALTTAAALGAQVVHRQVATAADAAALAAADVASGAVPGGVCEAAAAVAEANRTALTECRTDELSVTVRVTAPWLALDVSASARAGPPP